MIPHVIRFGPAAALISLMAMACGGTSVTELTGPDAVRCQISLGAASANAPAAGMQVNVAVVAERDCTWSSQSQVSWIQVAPASGQGDGSLSVKVAANSATSGRSGNVVVNGAPFLVIQAGAPAPPPPPVVCTYTLDPPSRSISENGGTRTVRVTTGPTCAWEATSTVSWITITSSTTGTGTADVGYRVDRNRGPADRVGAIIIGGRLHVVSQAD